MSPDASECLWRLLDSSEGCRAVEVGRGGDGRRFVCVEGQHKVAGRVVVIVHVGRER